MCCVAWIYLGVKPLPEINTGSGRMISRVRSINKKEDNIDPVQNITQEIINGEDKHLDDINIGWLVGWLCFPAYQLLQVI